MTIGGSPRTPRGTTLCAMPEQPRVVIVMPAYNAARTLERTYADIPHDLVDHVILVDDVSRDETVEIARQLGLEVIVHRQNLGYGGNQKTCYDRALEWGADVVVMLHPDYQYDATRIPELVAPILAGDADLMLGQPVPRRPARGRHAAAGSSSRNRFLTGVENRGLRAAPVRVPHRAARLQPAPARDDPVPAQLGRLRVRPGADRPGRRGGRDAASARSPSRPATSRRRARSGSGGASSTACRRCGSSRRYLLHRTRDPPLAPAAPARPRRASPAPPDDAPPRSRLGRAVVGVGHLDRRAVPRRPVGRRRRRVGDAQDRAAAVDRRPRRLRDRSTSCCARSAGGCCSRRSPTVPVPDDARLAARRLPRQQRAAGPARRGRPEPRPRGRGPACHGRRSSARSSSSASSTRSWWSRSPRSRSWCSRCAGSSRRPCWWGSR